VRLPRLLDREHFRCRLEAAGQREVAFCGVDEVAEVAEVAYLSLRETGLKLVAVMDDARAGDEFFGVPVVSLADGVSLVRAPLVVSSLKRRDELLKALETIGIPSARIHVNSAETN
jgi:hypothetical protein